MDIPSLIVGFICGALFVAVGAGTRQTLMDKKAIEDTLRENQNQVCW